MCALHHYILTAFIIWSTLVLVAGAPVLTSAAFAAGPLAGPDTSSPRTTYQSYCDLAAKLARRYIDYRADKSREKNVAINDVLHQMRRLFDLNQVPPATKLKVGGTSAILLMDVFNRLPEIRVDDIPGGETPNDKLPDRWIYPQTEIQIVRIADGPRSGEFLFSSDTVERLPEFHRLVIGLPPVRSTAYDNWRLEHIQSTGPFFSYCYLEKVPNFLQETVLSTPLWKVILSALALIVLLGFVFCWTRFTIRFSLEFVRVRQLLWRLTAPILLALLVLFLDSFIAYQISLSGPLAEAAEFTFSVILNIAMAWIVWLGCFFLVELIIASPAIPDDSYDAHLLRLIGQVAALLGVAGVLIYGAHQLGLPALGLVASLGVGGFALALAAQSTVENLFGGVSIFADRPFRVGHFIEFGGNRGTVEAIGPRSSRIRSRDGTLITVPNSDLAKMHITNFSMRNKCLFLHTIGLRFETSIEQLEWLLQELRARLSEHDLVETVPGFPRIRIVRFGPSSIDIEIRAHVLTSIFDEFLEVQERLILEVMRIVDAAGTDFAFPSQTTYLARDTGIDQLKKPREEEEIRRHGVTL